MSTPTKKEKMRDLLCYAINTLLDNNIINLNAPSEKATGFFQTEILGKPSVITWNEKCFEELRISIWWGYQSNELPSTTSEPLCRKNRYSEILEVCCSGWLERKEGKWLQGYGPKGIFDTYCAEKAVIELKNIPQIIPNGFFREGKYFI